MRSRFLLLMLVGLLVVTGCGKSMALFMPDPRPRVPREFDLPSGKIAILIDDHLANLPREEMKIQIADEVTDLLKSEGRLKRRSFLHYEDVLGVDSEKAQGGLNSIQHIGREVGADLVIYINVTEFELQSDPDSPLVMPGARALVKVIEVATGERLWPIDMEGHPVQVRGRREVDELEGRNRAKWNEKLCNLLANEIAQLFYDHPQSS